MQSISWPFGFEYYFDIPCVYALNQGATFLTYITSTPRVWAVDAIGSRPSQFTFFQAKGWMLDTPLTRSF